jgi:hypothetical protein
MEKKVTAINPHILYNHTHTETLSAGSWMLGYRTVPNWRQPQTGERERKLQCVLWPLGVGVATGKNKKNELFHTHTDTPEVKCSQHKVERSFFHIFLEKYKNQETMSELVRVLMSFFPGHMCRPGSSVSHFTSVPDGIGFFSLSTGTHCGYEWIA